MEFYENMKSFHKHNNLNSNKLKFPKIVLANIEYFFFYRALLRKQEQTFEFETL